jgi:hypothetical protein
VYPKHSSKGFFRGTIKKMGHGLFGELTNIETKYRALSC